MANTHIFEHIFSFGIVPDGEICKGQKIVRFTDGIYSLEFCRLDYVSKEYH